MGEVERLGRFRSLIAEDRKRNVFRRSAASAPRQGQPHCVRETAKHSREAALIPLEFEGFVTQTSGMQ
jgi:hypothetical protein